MSQTESGPSSYRAFISYSHKDEAWATWLHRRLERFRVPKAMVGRETPLGPVPGRIYPVFRDREELPTAADLGAMIESALRRSASMIVVCSPASASSLWVDQEIRQFKRIGRSDRIQALIVDGEPNASDKAVQSPPECFPLSLRFDVGGDGELTDERREPIAADARPGKDGRIDSFLKLAAGILGIGYDDLKRRELRRKRIRAALLSSAAAVLFAVMAALTVLALVSRNQAVAAQREAETQKENALEASRVATDARNEAEKQRSLAEENAAQTRLRLGEMRLAEADAAVRDADWTTAASAVADALDLGVSANGLGMLAGLVQADSAALEYELARLPTAVVDVVPDPDGTHLAAMAKDGRAYRFSLKSRAPTAIIATGINGFERTAHLLRSDGRAVLTEERIAGSDFVLMRDLTDTARQPLIAGRQGEALFFQNQIVIQEKDQASVYDPVSAALMGHAPISGDFLSKTVSGNGVVASEDLNNNVRMARLASGDEIASGKDCTWIGMVSGWPAWGDATGQLHVADGMGVHTIPGPLDMEYVKVVQALRTPDGSTVAILRSIVGQKNRLMEVLSNGRSSTFPTGIEAERITVDPSGRWLAAADSRGHVALWRLPGATPVAVWTAHVGEIMSLVFTKGELLVTAGDDGRILVWGPDRAVNAGIIRLPIPIGIADSPFTVSLQSIRAASTSNLLVTSVVKNGKALVQWWHNGALTGSRDLSIAESLGQSESLTSLSLNTDGRAAVGATDGGIQLVAPDGKVVATPRVFRKDGSELQGSVDVAWCGSGNTLFAAWAGDIISPRSAFGFTDVSHADAGFSGWEALGWNVLGMAPGTRDSGLLVADDGSVFLARKGRAVQRVAASGVASKAWSRAGSGRLLTAGIRGWVLWSEEGRKLDSGELPSSDVQCLRVSASGNILLGTASSQLFVRSSGSASFHQIDLSRERVAEDVLTDSSGEAEPVIGIVDVGWADEGRYAWVILTDTLGHNQIGLVDVLLDHVLLMERLVNKGGPRLVIGIGNTAVAFTTGSNAAILPAPGRMDKPGLRKTASKKPTSWGDFASIDVQGAINALPYFEQMATMSSTLFDARVAQSLASDPWYIPALIARAWGLLRQGKAVEAKAAIPALPAGHPWAPRCTAFSMLCAAYGGGKLTASADQLEDKAARAIAVAAEVRAGTCPLEEAVQAAEEAKNYDEVELLRAMNASNEFYPLLLRRLLTWYL